MVNVYGTISLKNDSLYSSSFTTKSSALFRNIKMEEIIIDDKIIFEKYIINMDDIKSKIIK